MSFSLLLKLQRTRACTMTASMIWNIREVKRERMHFLTQRHLASIYEDIHFNYLEILASIL